MSVDALVPADLRGVWTCTRVSLPDGGAGPGADHATPAWARWLQTSLWHGHLSLPHDALRQREARELSSLSPQQLAALTHQQAHVGRTQIQPQPEGELCTWLRRADYQPPASVPDTAWLVFDAPDRLLRMALHDEGTEVWQRLPDSVGRFRCLAGLDTEGQDDGRRVMVAGAYAMRVQLRAIHWPRGMRTGFTLAEAMMHAPQQALAWLDREISFGRCEQGRWTVERSTLPAQEGRTLHCEMLRDATDPDHAWLSIDGVRERWRVLEWSDG
ncbi:MAG: hypothetical protein IIA02_13900 [Proteobacteria bacterium]|uniref:hypothetical protein n=1 Tax=Aquabacterium sp. TaxID=1872578 RepID=UPI0035C70CE1|nr:hypothetical protein [Pseudomonadota bacterium]